ncbi:hypothetical protein EYZ11_001155 [Aspergillus tanneri]|uniref:Uncharacterized protein n=1 Tax=Aspergillus tanneri TaxID=1220188 RepID=A0A4S3JVC6_9EURO|nr:hypothetical protein EYZ11_001155 [Aspergillus tanneri]
MKLSAILPAFAAFHLVQGLEAPVPGYGVEEFTWEVETKPGGPTVALNGTIQEIYAELIEINPIYDLDFAARATEASISNDDGTPHLRKRFDVTCNIYTKTLRTRIQEGITYLRGVSAVLITLLSGGAMITRRQKPLAGSTTLPIVLRLSSINVAQLVALSLAKRIMGITGEALFAGIHAELAVGE